MVNPSPNTTSTQPTVSTDCPATGQARAAYLQSIVEPRDQTIVYQYTRMVANQTSLKYYDVTTHTKNNIYAVPVGETLADPMLSADGKWVLFVSYTTNGGVAGGNEKVQVVGVNGRVLQTIYCTDSTHGISSIQWSPDLAHIALSTSSYTATNAQPDGNMYILNTANGNLQTVPSGSAYEAIGWQNTTHLYVAKAKAGQVIDDKELDLLNITGPITQVQTVFDNPHNAGWLPSLSPDGQRLYIHEWWVVNSKRLTDIVTEPASGGQGTIIPQGIPQTDGTAQICAATNQTLLVSLSGDGLYTMNPDGQNVVRMSRSSDSVQAGCMYSWQTVSRDSSLFAFVNSNTQSNKLYYCSLFHSNTQPMTLFADTGNTKDTVSVVGWTMD